MKKGFIYKEKDEPIGCISNNFLIFPSLKGNTFTKWELKIKISFG